MEDVFMTETDLSAFVDFLMDTPLGQLISEHRHLVVAALGEKMGIWPEYTRPDDERVACI